MTNKSAIVIIKAMITTHKSLEAQGINSDVPFDEESIEALNMAIDSLKREPNIHGHWNVVSDGYGDNAYICECSECKDTVWVYKDADRKWNYCPKCGADMRGE